MKSNLQIGNAVWTVVDDLSFDLYRGKTLNGSTIDYQTCQTGKTFIPFDPIDFIDKVAALIPPARRHRHHYHGAFAPNSTLRRAINKVATHPPTKSVPPALQEAAKVSFTWAKLFARIYDVNPLLCPWERK